MRDFQIQIERLTEKPERFAFEASPDWEGFVDTMLDDGSHHQTKKLFHAHSM